MNKDFFSKERFKYIIILALFNYIFLGTEYLFDNIVGDIKPQSVVTAQSYILGASVLGFLFFAIIKKYINKKFASLMSPTTSSVAQNLFYAQNQLIDITYIQKLSTFF